MATKTRDIPPLVKGKRSPNTSKTQSLVVTNAINLIASNRKNIYLKSKVSSSHDKTQGKKPTPSTYGNIHHKQTLNHRTSIDKPPSSFDNTQVKKNPTLSNDLNIGHNKPNITQGSLFDNRPFKPSSFDNAQGKKLASSSCVPTSIHNKQTLARRRLSFDNRPPQSSSLDHNSQGKKLASLSCLPPSIHNKQTLARRRLSFDNRSLQSSSLDHNAQGKKLASSISDSNIQNKQTPARRRLSFDHRPPLLSFRNNSPQSKKLVSIHRKQTPTRRRLSIDHKPPMSSPLLKHRTSSNPRERLLKPPLSSSSKNSTSQKPLSNKLSKAPHTSYKDVIGKQHGAGLYDKAVNMNKTITKKQDSPATVANIDPHEGEELKHEEYQELIIEDHEDLSETVNIDEYLKAAESSPLYVVENQQVIKMEPPEDQQLLVEETSIIKSHKELEEIKNLEPSNENQKEKEKGEESETSLKTLDDCQQKKDLDLNTHQEEKEESEGRNNKGKEDNNNNKVSTTTMAFAKAYPHLVHKKESVVSSNDVIEETASKLRDQRKNRVKALASAFETVISLQDPK